MKRSMMLAASTVIALCGTAQVVLAQDGKPAQAPSGLKLETIQIKPEGLKTVAPAAAGPVWSSDDAKKIGEMLSGSWKTTTPVKAEGGQAADVVIGIAPVAVQGVSDILYVEMAKSDALNRPYRHVFWHLSKMNGEWRMQTLEFRRNKAMLPSAIGLWAAPEAFPTISMDDLVATMTIPFTSTPDGFSGKTASPFPTTMGGAVEMTSAITFNASTFTSDDRGFDASGKQVWGPETGQKYTFAKADVGVKAKKLDGGLVVINYPSTLTGQPAQPGEIVTVNYAVYLQDGTVADSSYERSQAFPYPNRKKLLDGWNIAMDNDTQVGLKRRLVVPGPLAYKEAGRAPKVGPNATLFIDIEVLSVAPAPPPPPPQPAINPSAPITNDPAALKPAEPPPEIKAKMEAEMRRRMEEKAKLKDAPKAPDAPPAAPK